ncbi:hypothetical protein [Methylobacterium sp. CM6246]
MAAAEQHVEEWVFRYTSEGDAKARASADQLTGSLDKLSGAQDRSAASNDKGIAASDRAARAKASQEAAAAKLQRQIEAENRALAASEAAQNAAAAATGGLTASQLRAIDAYAAATRAGNDNAAAVGRQGEVFKAAGKTIAEHPVLVLAASVAAARALSGLATSAAGSLGAASASTAAFAEGAAGMGPAVGAGATLAARGLAGLSIGATAAAGGLGLYAEKVAGFTTATSLLSRGLSLIPPLFLPIAAAFVAFEVGSAVFSKAYADLQRLIDLGEKARRLDVGAAFLKSFESLGPKIQATGDQMDAALSKAASFLKMNWGQDNNNLSKMLNDITATGAAGAGGLKSTALADTATTTEERIKAAVAGMKELDELGLHLASLKVGDAVFGADFMERLRTGQTTIAQLSADLEAASQKEVLNQDQVDRAVALNRAISDTKQAISDAWAVNVDFSAAATLLNEIWLKILQTVLYLVQTLNEAISSVTAFGAAVLSSIGGAFDVAYSKATALLSTLGIIAKQQAAVEVQGPPEAAGPAPQKITGRDLGYVSTVVDGRKLDKAAAGAKQAKQAATEAASSYDNLIQKTKDHITELDLEAQYVGKDADAVIKLKLANQLARAAQKDGTEVTAEMRAEWDRLGDTLAASTKRLEETKRAYEQMKEGQRELASEFGEFADDLILGGKKMSEAFTGLAKTLSSNALKAVISGEGPLAGLLGTASTEKGQIGGLLGGGFNFSSLLGGGSNAAGSPLPGAQGPSLPSSSLFGGLFDGDKISNALGLGAETGIGKALGDALKPQKAGGGILSSQLGQGLVSAGAGASIGYSSQSPLMGALGGGLAGLASGNPIMAIAGAGAGLLGGLFGESQAKKEAKKKLQQELQARKEALDQARPQIEALAIQFEGGSIGNVGKQIVDAEAQMRQAAKTASDGGDRALADKLVKDYQTYVARMTAQFADGFNGILAEVEAGFGTSGPFSQALSSVQSLGEALKGFVADAGRISPAATQAARGAAVQGALSALNPTPQLSETQTEFDRIQGTAAGLSQVLKDLGLSADQAAQAINDGTNKALAALAEKFDTDLDRKIYAAKGKDYLNDASDLLKEVGSLNDDAARLGQDGSKVGDYFSAAAQKIVDNSQLVGDAFNELISSFPQLAGVVHEYSAETSKTAIQAQQEAVQAAQEAAQKLSEIQDRKRGYEDRAFAVNFSDNSLATKLTAFERSAEWERWTEGAKGNQAIDDLVATQDLERQKLIYDYNQAVNDRRQAAGTRQLTAQSDGGLNAQLGIFDRNAVKERQDEVKAGGEALVQLEAAQAAERWKIVKAYYDAVNDRIRTFSDRTFAATNDESTLGGKLAAFQRTAAQQQVEEAKVGGEAMAALLQAQGAEQQKIINDYYKAVRDRQTGYQDRAFAAGNDGTTLAGQLAAFERQAEKDRLAELQVGGEAMLDLTRAQEAERAKIIRDYYEAVNQRILSFQDRTFAATNTTDLAGQLAAFDRSAAAERLAEIKSGGEALTALMAAQNAERQKLVDEYNEAITERRAGYQDRTFAAANDNSLSGQLAAFERQAQKERADEIKAGGEAILDLTAAQEAERAKIVKDYGDAVKVRISSNEDRLFAANTDADTLAGQLAAFDRKSARERIEEAKAGGEAMTSLEAAQAAERLKVIEDFNKQAKAAFDDFANTIKKFLDQMLAGSSSPLSPEDRFKVAQTQYDEQLKLAQGGDKTALGGITGYAQSLLDAGKVYYASSQAFQDIFQQIYDQLGKLPDQVGQKAFGDTGSTTGGSALSDSVTSMIAAQYASSVGAANDVGSATPQMAVPVNQDAALLAELKAIGARLDALRDDVKENTGVDEEGHLQTIQALKDVGTTLAKGKRESSRREVA